MQGHDGSVSKILSDSGRAHSVIPYLQWCHSRMYDSESGGTISALITLGQHFGINWSSMFQRPLILMYLLIQQPCITKTAGSTKNGGSNSNYLSMKFGDKMVSCVFIFGIVFTGDPNEASIFQLCCVRVKVGERSHFL